MIGVLNIDHRAGPASLSSICNDRFKGSLKGGSNQASYQSIVAFPPVATPARLVLEHLRSCKSIWSCTIETYFFCLRISLVVFY